MNPILTSAMFGFLKGLYVGGGNPAGHPGPLHTCLLGPAAEELQFRTLPRGVGVPTPLASAAFALAHFVGEHHMTPAQMGLRFADVFAGGQLYSAAYDQMGFLGAVAAHGLHNLMCDLGRQASPRAPRYEACPPHRITRRAPVSTRRKKFKR